MYGRELRRGRTEKGGDSVETNACRWRGHFILALCPYSGQRGTCYKKQFRDFPGGPVKNPPTNSGDRGSIPVGGTKIPYALEQLSLCAIAKTRHGEIDKIYIHYLFVYLYIYCIF